MSRAPIALWSCRDAGDPPRVSGSAGALAGCVRCRAGRLAGNLSSVGLWTPAGSGSDPQPSARTRCVSERPGTPSPWCSRHRDRCARPHAPQRRSGRATFCHPRHAYDVPASPRTRDSRRRQGISAVVLWKDGSCRRSSGAAHVVDDSARLRRPDPCPASASGSESGALRRTRESGLEGPHRGRLTRRRGAAGTMTSPIRQCRGWEALGVSQAAFASQLGVPLETYRPWNAGRRTHAAPGMRRLWDLVRQLGFRSVIYCNRNPKTRLPRTVSRSA